MVRYINHYREPFYRGLGDALDSRGIDFEMIHGSPSASEAVKKDSVTPDWTTIVENRVFQAGNREFVHQPVMGLLTKKDLVIVEQASRLLLNYRLLLRRRLRGGPAVALIGHGANLAATPSRSGEAAKRLLTQRIDWFFAYTEGTKRLLEANGFPAEHITVFNNTLDLRELRAQVDSVTEDEVSEFRAQHGIGTSPLILTLGSLYPGKRPDLAIETGALLASRGTDAHLMLIGSGELEGTIRQQAAREPWLHHIDAAFGRDKALALRAADALLIPGVAGLVVLDGFAAGLPIITAMNDHHPPEIDYIDHRRNGLIVEHQTSETLADSIANVLADVTLRSQLGSAARETGSLLTIDGMIERFADGVVDALAS